MKKKAKSSQKTKKTKKKQKKEILRSKHIKSSDIKDYHILYTLLALTIITFLFLLFISIKGGINISTTFKKTVFYEIIFHPQKEKITIPKFAVVMTPTQDTLRDNIVNYIKQKFENHSTYALCIAYHESGLNPLSIHYEPDGTTDKGVFQINSSHGFSESMLYNWRQNIDIAYSISNEGTKWTDWTSRIYC